MNKLQHFTYENNEIRTISVNNEPWFVGKDICSFFGDTNYRRSLSRIDDEEKGVSQIDTLGGPQKMVIVDEAGLYSLLFAMQPQKANMNDAQLKARAHKIKQFKRWITHDVIPSIRKHGLYATDELLSDPDLLIAALQELKAERERTKMLQLMSAIQVQQIAEMQPKAGYYDLILQNKNTVPVTQIAKDYGMSGQGFNKLLHELDVQFKMRDTWLLYQEYADQGYTQSRTHAIDADRSVMHTYWTQKGRLFLYDLLKGCRGILPMIERGVK